ncbi:DUF922 domain-containing protein [Mesorhizobium shangrilense]|uniref:DUF922 domain-containing protein n=1 Tax=Mesorhizobium shangrilense TaxID=460060 RepID=A0ABV2DCE6_9HYPH
MRLTTVTLLAAVGVAGCFSSTASAGVKINVVTRTYDVTGTSGQALVASMDRSGPRHGFMARAIAQTNYTKTWDFDFTKAKGACRIKQASGTLNLNFVYPRIASPISPALEKHWKRFIDGVTAHEETHGRIAREMMAATDKSLTGLTVPDDPQCSRTRREAKRRIDAIYDEYEDKQNAFDAREHREGGHVEYLLNTLEAP